MSLSIIARRLQQTAVAAIFLAGALVITSPAKAQYYPYSYYPYSYYPYYGYGYGYPYAYPYYRAGGYGWGRPWGGWHRGWGWHGHHRWHRRQPNPRNRYEQNRNYSRGGGTCCRQP